MFAIIRQPQAHELAIAELMGLQSVISEATHYDAYIIEGPPLLTNMDEREGSEATGSEVSMSLPNLFLGILWSPYAKIHLVIGLSAMIISKMMGYWQVDNFMANIMENKAFWFFVAIMQPLLYFISLEYFGQIIAIAIPWSILILYLIWLWNSGKIPFASDEEE